jgi:hypothetical protein
VPLATSPMPVTSKNWFGLVEMSINLVWTNRKISWNWSFGLVGQNFFGADWYLKYENNTHSYIIQLLVTHSHPVSRSVIDGGVRHPRSNRQ